MDADVEDARTAALGGLFDDAAIFPPASRTLADAIEVHRRHRDGDLAWLVRRLLVRASDVPQVGPLLAAGDRLAVGVLLDLRGDGSVAERIGQDVHAAATLAGDGRLQVDAMELTPVLAPGEDGSAAAAQLETLRAALADAALPDLRQVAIEVPVAGTPAGRSLEVLEAIADARGTGGSADPNLIAKVRCGGVQAGAIPEDLELAGFLLACARLSVPCKATAGLHHPVRTTNPAHGGLEHGFLNLLAAAVAAAGGRAIDDIEAELARGADGFRLGPRAMMVGDAVVETDQLAATRRDVMLGIGCCEVTDPVADLAERGVLTKTGALT